MTPARQSAPGRPCSRPPASTRTRRVRSPTSCGRTKLDEVVGQDHLLGPDGALTRMLATRSLGSLVFWGPPGTGKTTVARLLAQATDLHFEQISAIFTGVADLKKVFEEARAPPRDAGRARCCSSTRSTASTARSRTSFLPVMEDGTIVLVGATTENPSFELNAPLLSRARVLVFKSLDAEAIEKLLARAEADRGHASCRSTTRRAPRSIAHGRRRRPRRAHAGRGSLARRAQGRNVRLRQAAGDRAAARADLRQGAGRPLQSDLARCTSRCAAPIPTPRCIISAACSMPASRRSTSRAAWCAWRSRISGSPIRRRW